MDIPTTREEWLTEPEVEDDLDPSATIPPNSTYDDGNLVVIDDIPFLSLLRAVNASKRHRSSE